MAYGKSEFTLSTADENGMLVKIRCGLCKQSHLYYAKDVLKLIGDLPLWDISSNTKCEECDTNAYLRADWKHVYGPDVGKTRARKLVRIRQIRVPVWKDEII